jgi:hypothetical protein
MFVAVLAWLLGFEVSLGFGFWILGFYIMIRVILPPHLRTLARVNGEVELDVTGAVTQKSILDALEARHPMLRGTIREHATLKRRPLVRFFVCGEDVSHEPPDSPLPEPIIKGSEPFMVIGAIAGG